MTPEQLEQIINRADENGCHPYDSVRRGAEAGYLAALEAVMVKVVHIRDDGQIPTEYELNTLRTWLDQQITQAKETT